MGYATQNLIAKSQEFQSRVEMALTKLLDDTISAATPKPKEVAMAKQIMQNLHIHVQDLARLLALAGLDLDSTGIELDTGIKAKIKWLLAKTGND